MEIYIVSVIFFFLSVGCVVGVSRLVAKQERQMRSLERYWGKRFEGQLAQAHIRGKIAEKNATLALSIATEAKIQVGALKRSTHRVQFMPLSSVLEKNNVAREEIDKLTNPGEEDFDFDDAILSPEQLAEKYMPNRLRGKSNGTR